MTDTTPNLALPELIAAQAQKHVTVNEALRALDVLVQLCVLDRDLAAPPASPNEGERWLVAAGPTGAWAGHAGDIAAFIDGAWDFFAPQVGWLAYVADEGALLAWTGSAWADAITALTSLNNMTLLGVGTMADATNPFSAKLNNVLWTARTAAEGGDGDLRWKMNKETATDTLSMLFQTAYSGRAEIGLTGDDDLHVKVSPDGTNWIDALSLDRTTGGIRFRAKETTVASAATCDIGAAESLEVLITGTTTITSFGAAVNAIRLVRFGGALTLAHNATSLVLPGGANITTAADDSAIAVSDGSGNWRVLAYNQAASVVDTGSWTPTLAFATVGNLSVTYTIRSGRYRRVGKLVQLWFNIVTSAFNYTTSGGVLQMTGLPAAAETGVATYGALSAWQGITKAGYTQLGGLITSGGTLLNFQLSGSGQAIANVTATEVPSGSSLQLSGSMFYLAG